MLCNVLRALYETHRGLYDDSEECYSKTACLTIPMRKYQIGDNNCPIPSSPRPSHPLSRTLLSPQPINPQPSVRDGNDHEPIPSQSQSGHNSQNLSSTSQSPSRGDIHVGFFVVGLVFLVFINASSFLILSSPSLAISTFNPAKRISGALGRCLHYFFSLFPSEILQHPSMICKENSEKKEREREAQQQFEELSSECH